MYRAILKIGAISPFLGGTTDCPPDPMNHVKIFQGWPLQDAPSKLVQLWYKSFYGGRFMPTGM